MLRAGEIRGTDWTAFEGEYDEEKAALEAQVVQFTGNLAKPEAESRVGEIEEALVERLQAIRAAAAGSSSAGDAKAVHAAIRRLFEAFILHPDEGRIQANLWLPGSCRKLIPVLHRDALRGVMPGGTPVLTRTQVDLVLSAGEDEGDSAGFTALSA